MYKNPRILKILQNVDYDDSPGEPIQPLITAGINLQSHELQENCSLLPEVGEVECDTFHNIEYDAPEQFTTLEISDNIQLDTYALQDDFSLLLEKEETSAIVTSTASNIIICNDKSLRRRSDGEDSSSCSISILNDSLLKSSTADNFVTNQVPELQIMISSQAKLEEVATIPSPSDAFIIEQTNIDSLSMPKSVTVDMVHGNDMNEQENTSTSATTTSSAGPSATSEQETFTSQLLPRKRQKKSCSKNWIVNTNKDQREKGKPYLGKKKIGNKWSFVEPKSERIIKDRCNCKLSLKGDTKFKCNKFPEEERQKCCKNFWDMSWKEKKVYIKMLAIYKRKKRERCAGPSSRRENSVELYLSDSKGNRYRVCKKMFLNSLCVSEWVIKKWVLRDSAPKNVPKNNAKDEPHKQLRRFFDSLPKLESHYCRKDSTKLYLEPLWTSKAQLYNVYKDDFCPRENAEPLSITSFCNVFEELNLSLFRPKKDLCDVCEGYKTGNIPETQYKIHQDMKEEARKELAKDTTSNNEVLCMDLQSVLLSPRSNVSSLYYKHKLIVHNFTIYDVKRNKGYCYIWNECEGRLTSNEFSTIIVTALENFIKQHSVGQDQELIIYSDGCTYQNRNTVLSNALLNFSMLHEIIIIQKYLEKGHTQMECDSMHSVIERTIKNKKINLPADYAYLAKVACKKNPYDVEYLYHHFFKNIENSLTFYKSIRPGKKAGDPCVTNLRALKYIPGGKIVYKLRHSSIVWEELPIRIKKISALPWNDIPQLYLTRLKIKKDKYLDLQALKLTMEKDYHKFYDDLPHF